MLMFKTVTRTATNDECYIYENRQAEKRTHTLVGSRHQKLANT